MRAKLAGAMIACSVAMLAQNPDNTKANKGDRESTAATADHQGNSKQDVELTRQIRKQIVAEKEFSTYAKNVKVIAIDGIVTLKGPVRSANEKDKIERIARQVAGDDKVKNEIQVVTN